MNSKLNTLIEECVPEKDMHSHITRNYCLDCAKRDGYNQAIDQYKSNLMEKLK